MEPGRGLTFELVYGAGDDPVTDCVPSSSRSLTPLCSASTAPLSMRLVPLTASSQSSQRTVPHRQAAGTTRDMSSSISDDGRRCDASEETCGQQTTALGFCTDASNNHAHRLDAPSPSESLSLSASSPCLPPPVALLPTSSSPLQQLSASVPLVGSEPSSVRSAGGEPPLSSPAAPPAEVLTEANIDGTRRKLIMNGNNRTGYYGVTKASNYSTSGQPIKQSYNAIVRGKWLGAFPTAVEAAKEVWRFMDEQELEPSLARPAEPLGPCPIGAPAKRKGGKGCGGFQRRGHPTHQDGPIGGDGQVRWRCGALFCGESACRPAAGVVNSQTRLNDMARKRPRHNEAHAPAPPATLPDFGTQTLPQFGVTSTSSGSGPSAMQYPQRSPVTSLALQPSQSSQPLPSQLSHLPVQPSQPRSPTQPEPQPSLPSLAQSLQPGPTQSQPADPSSSQQPRCIPLSREEVALRDVLMKRPVEYSTLAFVQREGELAHLPIELEVAFFPNLMKLLQAFNQASDRHVAQFLQKGVRGGDMASMSGRALKRQLEAAVARIISVCNLSQAERRLHADPRP